LLLTKEKEVERNQRVNSNGKETLNLKIRNLLSSPSLQWRRKWVLKKAISILWNWETRKERRKRTETEEEYLKSDRFVLVRQR
jgi:hypothetical protein